MFNYVKLPNQLFYTKNDKSILQKVKDDKVILVLIYLYNAVNRKDIMKFTLGDMISECGFIPKTGEKKSNEQFKNILIKLEELEIISFADEIPLNKIKSTQLLKCKFNKYIEKGTNKDTGEIQDIQFVELTNSEKETILTYSKTKINNIKLLIYFTYLKCRIHKRSKSDGDLACTGGQSETCYLKYNKITADLGLSDQSIKEYNDILIEINLIRISNPGIYYYAEDKYNTLRESPNFFTLFNGNEENAKLQFKEAIKSYKALDANKNKIWTNSRQYKNNNRSINGKKGNIIRKQKSGKELTYDEKMFLKQLDCRENEDVWKLKSVFSAIADDERPLSEYYCDLAKEDRSEYYKKIEDDLELFDTDGNMKVDYTYYEWVITNYLYGEHKGDVGYFNNCVKKHIEEAKLKVIRLGKTTPFKEGKTTKFSYTQTPVLKEFDTKIDF